MSRDVILLLCLLRQRSEVRKNSLFVSPIASDLIQSFKYSKVNRHRVRTEAFGHFADEVRELRFAKRS